MAAEVAPNGPGTGLPAGVRRRDEVRSHGSPPAAVRAAARRGARPGPRTGAPAPCGRRRGRRRARATTPTGAPRRADELGHRHRRLAELDDAAVLGRGAATELLGRDQRERGRVQLEHAERRARATAREHVRDARARAVRAAPSRRRRRWPAPRWHRARVRAVVRHRIADLGSAVCSSEMRPGVSALAHLSTRTAIS